MAEAPLVIAHRGDSAHRPENTLASMAGALELGVSAVEFDVQLTRDGHTVVMVTHDPVAAAQADRVLMLADGRLVGTLEAPDADEVAEHLAHLGG